MKRRLTVGKEEEKQGWGGTERNREGKVESIKVIKMEQRDKNRGGEEQLRGGQGEGSKNGS